MIGKDNQILEQDEFTIDWDMFGGGFIKATQSDDDQELNLIAWGQHAAGESYLLDYSAGGFKRNSYMEAPEEIREITKQWHKVPIEGHLVLFLAVLLCFVYYMVVPIIWFAIRMVRRHRAGGPKQEHGHSGI